MCQFLLFSRVNQLCVCQSPVMSDSLRLHGLQLARLLCPWDFPGKNTGVGCHSLLQGIFPTQGSNLGLLHCRQILYSPSHQGISFMYTYISSFFGFPQHLVHHRALCRVPCAKQQLLICYLFYAQYQSCICVNPNLPIHPISSFPPWYPYVFNNIIKQEKEQVL